MRLAAFDFALVLIGSVLALGLVGVLEPSVQVPYQLMLSLNVSLAFGFCFILRYLDLSEARYSLGKALLIGFTLWLINGSALWSMTSSVPVASLAVMAVVYGFLSLVSGCLHYELSGLFMQKKANIFYFWLERRIKRLFDWTASVLGLIAVSPIMVLVPILLCLESKGSPIFAQTRVGEGKRTFEMYKFRSMVKDADQMPQEKKTVLFKRDDDPRVTRLGRIIRKLSIDELPQLWNVVCGEMSLVGPRPPLPSEFEMMNWYHKRKFEVTPGLTGLWQIVGRVKNQRDFNSVAAYDVYYIENWCLMEDLKILLKTIPVVLFQKGAC